MRVFFLWLKWLLNYWQFCDLLLHKSHKAYLGLMLPPGDRNWQLIDPKYKNCLFYFWKIHLTFLIIGFILTLCHLNIKCWYNIFKKALSMYIFKLWIYWDMFNSKKFKIKFFSKKLLLKFQSFFFWMGNPHGSS